MKDLLKSFLLPAALAVGSVLPASAVTYYIDSLNGADDNAGTSESTAWKSFANVDTIIFTAGDSLLLKAGSVFTGPLEITGHGTEKNPVIVGKWGFGADPLVEGRGAELHAVRVYNSDYVTVQDLEITNTGKERKGLRCGIKAETDNYGWSRGIVFRRLYVHDVNGMLEAKYQGGNGIYFESRGEKVKSAFDGLLIEECHVARCARNGIYSWGTGDRSKWLPSKNVIIRANLVEQIPGDGIQPGACDGCIVEYNLVRDGAPLPKSEASAGIWPGNCDNTIVRYNEVYGMCALWDGQGFDCDYNCRNTLMEYNYSHDNDGGFLLVCCPGEGSGVNMTGKIGNIGSVVKYNISVNDGIRPVASRNGVYSPVIHIGGTSVDTEISYNILHANVNPVEGMDNSMITSDSWSGFSDNTRFINNLFYAAGPSKFNFSKSTRDYFNGNWYVGDFTGKPKDSKGRGDSRYYRSLLKDDPSGFVAVAPLLSQRRIANGKAIVKYVNPKAIKKFFKTLSKKK